MPWNTDQKGLTLIELTILLLVVAILYSFAMPKIRVLTDVNLTTSARRLAETIRAVRSSAITHSSQYMMRFDIEKGTYGYEEGTEYAPGRWQFVLRDKGQTDEKNSKVDEKHSSGPRETTFKLDKGVFFQDICDPSTGEKHDKGEIRTEFSPRGIATRMLIHIGNKSTFYTLLVERYGGEVTMRKGNLSYQDFLEEESKRR